MKLSELITRLQYIRDEHGDIDVRCMDDGMVIDVKPELAYVVNEYAYSTVDVDAMRADKGQDTSDEAMAELWTSLDEDNHEYFGSVEALKAIYVQGNQNRRDLLAALDAMPLTVIL